MRVRDEVLLEGPHFDPDGGEAMAAIWDIIVTLTVLAFLLLVKIPVLLIGRAFHGKGRHRG